jgi:peptide/nickel transport system substrate-binding protein
MERTLWTTTEATGQFDVSVPWTSFVQASGDSWPEVNGRHPDNYLPVGEDIRNVGGAAMRLRDPKIGEFIDSMVPVNPDTQENIDITTEFLQYWTENMYAISTISFKKFVTWDETYWTGFPTFENPSSQPLYWFQGGKVTFQNLVAAGS